VLYATSVAGNVLRGDAPGPAESMDRVRLSRQELEKARIRRRTERGADLGVALERGSRLRHGDVLTDGSSFVMVEQAPEKVLVARWPDGAPPETAALLGHAVGNLHRPLSVEGGAAAFPIQADSEIEVFEKMLSGLGVELSVQERVFCPHEGADVHGHG